MPKNPQKTCHSHEKRAFSEITNVLPKSSHDSSDSELDSVETQAQPISKGIESEDSEQARWAKIASVFYPKRNSDSEDNSDASDDSDSDSENSLDMENENLQKSNDELQVGTCSEIFSDEEDNQTPSDPFPIPVVDLFTPSAFFVNGDSDGMHKKAPSLTDAPKALKDLNEILKPHRKNGPGYKDPNINSFFRERLQGMAYLLSLYTDPWSRDYGKWMTASYQVALVQQRGNTFYS